MDWTEDTPDFSARDLEMFDYGEGKTILLQKLDDDEGVDAQILYGEYEWDKWFKYLPEKTLETGFHSILCRRALEVFDEQPAPVSYLPFSRELWQRITKQWHVHRTITRTMARQVAYFSVVYSGNAEPMPRKIHFTMRMSAYLPNDIALSLTFNPRTSSTYSVVYGCNSSQAHGIEKSIRSAGFATEHPLLMVGIFAEMERERLGSIADDLVDRFTLRSEILDNTYWNPEVDMTGEKTQEYLALCLQSRGLIDHIRAVKRQLKKLPSLADEIDIWLLCARDPSAEEFQRITSLKQIGVRIRKRLSEILDELDDKIDECSMISESLSLTMQTVWNHFARHDSKTNTEIAQINTTIALETKRDNTQMRSIALMTMIYIPLSCVASVFSTSLFNFQASNGKEVVSRYFWIFLVVSIGLTAITVLAWYFANNRDIKKEKRTNSFALRDVSMV